MDNFDLKKYLAEGRLLKEELTFSFDEYSYEIDDDAYQAEVEAGKTYLIFYKKGRKV